MQEAPGATYQQFASFLSCLGSDLFLAGASYAVLVLQDQVRAGKYHSGTTLRGITHVSSFPAEITNGKDIIVC